MVKEDFKIDRFHERFNGAVPSWFLLGSVCNYNFKSFRRYLIYISHYGSVIDLCETSSKEISDEQIIAGIQPLLPSKIPKKVLYELTGLNSRTTFNERFRSYFKEHGLVGRRTFTLLEIYKILEYWQGDGKWGRLQAAKKEMLAEVLHNKNYERTADDFRMALGENAYKPNLISPKKIKQVIKHMDLTEEEAVEKLVGYKEFQSQLLWIIGIIAALHFIAINRNALNLNE